MPGECEPMPANCDITDTPRCGCNGVVYASTCHAARAGQDVSVDACQPPLDTFTCGDTFCPEGTHYCEEFIGGVQGLRMTYECRPLPAVCQGTATCECLAGEPCGSTCYDEGDTFILTCMAP